MRVENQVTLTIRRKEIVPSEEKEKPGRWEGDGEVGASGSQMKRVSHVVLVYWQASGAACPFSWELFAYLLHFYKI